MVRGRLQELLSELIKMSLIYHSFINIYLMLMDHDGDTRYIIKLIRVIKVYLKMIKMVIDVTPNVYY